jgi:hypothetical protein
MTEHDPRYNFSDQDTANLTATPALHMTLRDYFAAKALQALIEIYEPDAMPGCVPACGRDAYRYADAMLEARKNEIRNP